MRTALLLVLTLVTTHVITAQFPDFQLVELQSLRRLNPPQTENKIRELGFDLASKTGAVLRYNKCWDRNQNGKPIYDQVLLWNTINENITFLTPNQEAFLALRKSIEGRHGQSGSLGSSDLFIGHVFKYQFGSEWLDGVMYWRVEIAFKQG